MDGAGLPTAAGIDVTHPAEELVMGAEDFQLGRRGEAALGRLRDMVHLLSRVVRRAPPDRIDDLTAAAEGSVLEDADQAARTCRGKIGVYFNADGRRCCHQCVHIRLSCGMNLII